MTPTTLDWRLRFKERFVHMSDGRWLIREWGAEPSEADFWDFIEQLLEEQRAYFIQEIKHVCKVHNYLPKEYEHKIVRFISNLDKPHPEISLTQKKEDTNAE